MSNWLTYNIPFFVAVLILIVKVIKGAKRGAVKEICSFISIVVASFAVLLIGFAVRKYLTQDKIIFIITLILLFLLILIYKILDLFLTTLKLISKLPVISFLDKLLGIPVAVCEVIIIIWTVYCLAMVFNEGAFARWIINCVTNNQIMRTLYEYNYIYFFASKFSTTLAKVDIWKYLGM